LTEPVTVVVSRTVKAGREPEYEQWIRDVTGVALKFQGHLGMNVFTPTAPGGPYVLIYKFDTGDHLDAWLNSSVRADFVRRAEEMCEESKAQHVTGLESWFTLPGAKTVLPPPRWKMAIVTGVTVWLMGLAIGPAVRWPFAQWAPDVVPAPVTALVTTAVMVALLTYVVMPRVTKALRGWLFVEKR
jgi:antibiotic biosynthesis monooxygenase (ABM) superfamily enzyme